MTKVINASTKKAEISFFPEGGSLVDGVPSVVAFKVTDANGRGLDVNGEIYTSGGEFVTAFRSSHKGMGVLFADASSREQGIGRSPEIRRGDSVMGEVPRSYPIGLGLNISTNKNKELLITVRTNNETLPSLLNEDLTIEISARNRLYKKAVFRMKSQADGLTIPVYDLPDGIYAVTLAWIKSRSVKEWSIFRIVMMLI